MMSRDFSFFVAKHINMFCRLMTNRISSTASSSASLSSCLEGFSRYGMKNFLTTFKSYRPS